MLCSSSFAATNSSFDAASSLRGVLMLAYDCLEIVSGGDQLCPQSSRVLLWLASPATLARRGDAGIAPLGGSARGDLLEKNEEVALRCVATPARGNDFEVDGASLASSVIRTCFLRTVTDWAPRRFERLAQMGARPSARHAEDVRLWLPWR